MMPSFPWHRTKGRDVALAWQDHAVILIYLLGMLAFGAVLAMRGQNEEEYFLAGRRLPWMAVGMSVIASLLSSLTYLSEPGEVWNSGVTHLAGKMLAIPFEMLLVWTFCIPFLMRFKFTSAYEYLEHRFDRSTRKLGVALFLALVVLWMGFVVLASSRALAVVSGAPLWAVIATVGVVATVYTMLGGLRAVVWTDVVQVILLIGGGVFTIAYISYTTQSGLFQWLAAANEQLQVSGNAHAMPLMSWDPRVRTTVVTVAINMCIWHVCTHTSNQMTVQRYYSTASGRAARRSFVVGSVFGVGINLMLVVVGLAVLYFYFGQGIAADNGLDPTLKVDRDLIFPTFAIHRLPPGVGGGILAALLAAAMSSIDSGVNSIATVLTVELRGDKTAASETGGQNAANQTQDDARVVGEARIITLLAGGFITVAAYGLSYLPGNWGIVDAMPRTFNAITGPLGALFLLGMFTRRATARGARVGVMAGLATSIGLGYFAQIGGLLHRVGWLAEAPDGLSFTWIMPSAVLTTFLVATIVSLLAPGARQALPGLTWSTRNEPCPWNKEGSETR